MDFTWTEEQLATKAQISRFASEDLNNGDVVERDREGVFSREIWQKCGQMGILGMNIPLQYGGQGQDLLTTVLALEALGYGCRDNGLTFAN